MVHEPAPTWTLANDEGHDIVRLDGSRVAIEIRRKGRSRHSEQVLADPPAALAYARKQVGARVAKGMFASDVVFERVRWSEVSAQIKVAGNGEEPDSIVLVHRGDLRVPHDLLLDYRTGLLRGDDPVIAGVLVEGDLVVEGCLANFEDDYGPCLMVTGDLEAETIATGGSQIRIDGDVRAAVVVGVYNHGCLDVGGTLHTRLVASEHTVRAGTQTGLEYGGWGGTIYAYRDGLRDHDDPYKLDGVFNRAVINGESVDLGKARRACVERKPILRDPPVSVREAFRKLVANKLAAPDKVRSLALVHKDLTTLPPELFAFTNLEKLDLTHNALRTLPDDIGKLIHLRELRLRGNGLVRLPDAIGDCRALRVLDLEANCLVDLPASLERCDELRVVNLRNNPYSYVRRSFGGWAKVQWMDSLPDVLTRLPRLEQLDFDDTLIRRLPATPFVSPVLAEITYEDTLLLDVDRALHPRVAAPDPARARRWAVGHIRFWFDKDHVQAEQFFDPRTGSYDFTQIRALLAIVLRVLVPAAAPYDEAVETFQKECENIVRCLRWDKVRAAAHVQALFGDLSRHLATLGLEREAPVLVEGLGKVFAAYVA
jgi:hypothetical protein